MNRDHRLLHISSVFDLRLVATKYVPVTDSHYREDDTDETEENEAAVITVTKTLKPTRVNRNEIPVQGNV